jgi:hypothetical protein
MMLDEVSTIHNERASGAYHPRNVARPIALRHGSMSIRIAMIQTAREHLNSLFMSFALKWSSHGGRFLPVDEGFGASTKYGL